ncbi:Multiple antibiotic resistance protein MarR [compost metagenome]
MSNNTEFLELGIQFRTLMKRTSQEWNKRMIDNLTMSQYGILYRLNISGMQKVSELAESMCITSGAITGVTDKLIAAGYAERHRDEHDRRVVYVQITEAGKIMVQLMRERQQETLSAFFEHLPLEDVQHLRRIFSKVLEQINED